MLREKSRSTAVSVAGGRRRRPPMSPLRGRYWSVPECHARANVVPGRCRSIFAHSRPGKTAGTDWRQRRCAWLPIVSCWRLIHFDPGSILCDHEPRVRSKEEEPISAMRVVHVSPMYFSDESYIGGGERYALELARAMAELVPTALVSFGRDRRTFTVDHLQVDIYPALRRRLEQPVSLAFLPSLAAADVIHCHHVGTASTTLALLAGRALGRPRFVTPLGLHASVTQDWLSRLAGISKLLCISQFSALQAPY